MPGGLRVKEVELSRVDRQFGAMLASLDRNAQAFWLEAGARLSAAVARGHLCFRAPESWRGELEKSALVGDGSSVTPLVLGRDRRLYTYRLWRAEHVVASQIRARATRSTQVPDEVLRQLTDRLFASSEAVETDWQRVAALTAWTRSFALISGGPGTGKTSTIVRIVVGVLLMARELGLAMPRIALLAPTGKATARMGEAIRRALLELDLDEELLALVPTEGHTLHRALGLRRGGGRVPEKLDADLVVVDEASMIDVELMALLLEATPLDARLVLLGDYQQLASVEAGAVLADVAAVGASYSPEFAARVRALSGDTLLPGATSGLTDCVVTLQHSYRYSAEGGLGKLASALRDGRADDALDFLMDTGLPEVEMRAPVIAEITARALAKGRRLVAEPEPARRLDILEETQIVTAFRRGPAGLERINAQTVGELSMGQGASDGLPIIVRKNDYRARLFNGDAGVFCSDRGALFLAARSADGGVEWSPASRVPAFDPAFAMSVHQSQGSEFDTVDIVLPRAAADNATRELLYTAVTRARAGVTLWCEASVLRAVVASFVERESGLADALMREDRIAKTQ